MLNAITMSVIMLSSIMFGVIMSGVITSKVVAPQFNFLDNSSIIYYSPTLPPFFEKVPCLFINLTFRLLHKKTMYDLTQLKSVSIFKCCSFFNASII